MKDDEVKMVIKSEEPEKPKVALLVCAVCRSPKGPLRKVKGAYYCEKCIKDIVKCYS